MVLESLIPNKLGIRHWLVVWPWASHRSPLTISQLSIRWCFNINLLLLGQKSLAGCGLSGLKELDKTDQTELALLVDRFCRGVSNDKRRLKKKAPKLLGFYVNDDAINWGGETGREIQKEEKARELDNHKSCFWRVPLVAIY